MSSPAKRSQYGYQLGYIFGHDKRPLPKQRGSGREGVLARLASRHHWRLHRFAWLAPNARLVGVSSQSLRHGVRGLPVGFRRHMAIDVGGDADGGMTEHTGHDLDWDTLGKHDRGCRVTQVVPRHRGQSQGGADPVPVLANVRVVQRRAPRTREDKVVAALCPFEVLTDLVNLQSLHSLWGE